MILMAGTMNDLQDCYDKKNSDFRDGPLSSHIRRFESMYGMSSPLSVLVRGCLTPISTRPTASSLRHQMPKPRPQGREDHSMQGERPVIQWKVDANSVVG